ncbi:MAG TPA: WD40 repeat domain-containing protein [Candidatus Limnocylindrales bacterium]|nr:WD40 repeat domain-containing protein [Candidatus Limnocylindrales bacterium]
MYAMRSPWRRVAGVSLLAIILLASAFLIAWAGAGQRPSLPPTFRPGSIAFARDGDLFLAAPDGSAPVRVAQGRQPGRDGIGRFAFSPDRRYLAFGMPDGSGGETLDIVSADGTTNGIYTWGGHPPGAPFVGGLKMAWSPDSSRLAVFPGAADGEIAIVRIDGAQARALKLPDGTAVSTSHAQFFAVLSWSPDSTWLAVAVKSGGDLSTCAAGNDPYGTCYILLATDGSTVEATSDHPSGYLAWAPDSRVAITHWAAGTIEIRPPDGSPPRVIPLPMGVKPGDGHVLAWSPDATRLVVASGPSTAGNMLVVINGDGTLHPAPIDDHFTGNGSNVSDIAWSMDGQGFLFHGTSSEGGEGIWSIGVAGGSPTRLIGTEGAFDVADGRP